MSRKRSHAAAQRCSQLQAFPAGQQHLRHSSELGAGSRAGRQMGTGTAQKPLTALPGHTGAQGGAGVLHEQRSALQVALAGQAQPRLPAVTPERGSGHGPGAERCPCSRTVRCRGDPRWASRQGRGQAAGRRGLRRCPWARPGVSSAARGP